ncbi:hypothetical protein [Butyrivibrio sp. JL13D10]|uniref:hypothetical protein n=1 Tax=Butyrivibrio sp. JL13D10 TaxID=3236815 RepID=UPI0038B4F09E
MVNKVYKRIVVVAMAAAMAAVTLTGCAGKTEAPEGTVAEVNEEAMDNATESEVIEEEDTAKADEAASDINTGATEETYHDANGWSVRYDPNLFTITPENGNVFMVYQGECAGTTMITVSYEVGKTAKEAIDELGKSWGDEDKVQYTDGPFPGAEDVTGYWASLPPAEDGSGMHETAIGRDYMEGALIFDMVGHNGTDEEQNMAVSDNMAAVIDSLTFD